MNNGLSVAMVLMAATVSLPTWAKSGLDPFFANQSLQQQAPMAFVLQPQATPFLRSAWLETKQQAQTLADAIIDDETLAQALSQWDQLSFDEQQPILAKVFELQCEQMGIEPPTLLIDDSSYPDKLAFFDFDVANPSSGTVYLNRGKLSQQPNAVSLALLIHETRHSYQFQLGFKQDSLLAQGYHAAFIAQQQLAPKSFADFFTLANEYEAFQFSNWVIGELFNWQLDMPAMGSYASQYWSDQQLKIDLLQMIDAKRPTPLLDQFNYQLRAQQSTLGR
ncbi:hypothetical protein [Ferrimonas lipolytica]|uniref:DUF2268 domain-containing protein n=1 Tax=Ferrimonas lipolytica TaxID=2724191 RepID=A0A6H1UFH7_9GAMM|nr:hypothetical protein [Ferrimonas lipolytica]QIZ76966.1 hypothetical protein HER31_08795 [Ferrimonas lipolytica]